jgi:predicted transcriptional regulator
VLQLVLLPAYGTSSYAISQVCNLYSAFDVLVQHRSFLLLQVQEAAKLEELANQVELLQSTLSKAANDLANAGTSTNAARQDLDSKR